MDPVSHAALGRTVIGAITSAPRLNGPMRGCVLAGVIGSLSPDIDLVLMPFGWDRYLRAHEVGTHTIAGTLVCALVTAAVVFVYARPTRYTTLALSAWLGAASHVLLDLMSSARLRLAWPFLDTVVTVPLVAMADPSLFALCASGAVGFWIWGHPRGWHAGIAVLAVMALFLIAKAVLGSLAVSNYRRASAQSMEIVLARAVEAKWASLDTWRVFDRTAAHVRSWSAGSGGAYEVFSWPLESDTPLVSNSRSLSTVRNFLRVHDLGFAVTFPQVEGRTLVLWSDIRYCWDASVPKARIMEPIVQSTRGTKQIACAFWFGGELDADGRPRLEVVKVAGFTQTRAPSP